MASRILMLEDSAMDTLLTVELLPQYDFAVVETLAAALEALTQPPPPDCIVTDLAVPDAKGVVIVTRLRAAAPTVPMVAHSGSNDPTLEAEVLAAGAQTVVVKEVGSGGLEQALSRALGG